MNHAITATYDAGSRRTTIPAIAAVPARAADARPALIRVRTDSSREGATERTRWPDSRFPNLRQVREEGERYDPDRESDEEDEANSGMTEGAWAYTQRLRDAQGLIDDAVNLLGVLLDAVEQDTDRRGAQVWTVLKLAVQSLHQAHRLVDEQESQDLDRFEANFEEDDPEKGQPARDD